MPRQSERFTIERHQDVAGLLVRLRDELERLGQDIGHSYGAGAAAEALSAVAAVDRVRELLDGELDRDFPRDPGQVGNIRLASVYYPPRWQERRAS
jgi:hypothetical protein